MEAPTLPPAASQRHERDLHLIQWRADIEAWQEDYDEAVADLRRLTKLVERHGEAIKAHRMDVENCEEGNPPPINRMTGSYASQLEQRGEHRRLEAEHRVLMAHLVMLKSAIEASR